MRRIFILCISLAMSALAFNNCAYPEWEPEPSTDSEGGYGSVTPVLPAVTDFSIVATIAQTKSELSETGELIWNDGDLVNVFHNVAGEANLVSDGVVYYDSKDEQENVFKGKLGKKLKEGYTYDWYVFYPYTADLSIVDNAAPVTIGSLAAGSQVQNGYGSAAHISGKGMPMYGTATGVEEGKTPTVELAHLSSVVELNIASCMPQTIQITEVKITAGEEIVGSFIHDFVKGTLTPVEGMSSNTAALVINDAADIEEGETRKFYLVVKPFVAKAADGLKITVIISLLACIFGTLLGAVVCWMRMSRRKYLRAVANVFIALMRGMPVLVLLMIMFYVIFAGTSMDPITVAVITFGMNFAAYVSEMFRSAIESVDKGQTEAGVALGFTPFKTFIYIVLPQAFKQVLPVFKGETISLVKTTSIVGFIAVQDLTKVGDIIRSRTFDAFFPLIMVAVLYFIVSWLFAAVLDYIGKKVS